MNQRKLAIVSVAAVAIIVIGAVVAYRFWPSHQMNAASQSPIIGKAALGQRAPEFAIPTTHGYFDLDKADKPVFLEVFATWCPHCQRETAVIDRLYAAYGSRVDFVGVSGSSTGMDGSSPETSLDVVNWGQRFNAKYPIAFDPNLTVANLYLQGGFPTLVVIDKNKNITYLDSGEVSYANLSAAIKRVL